MGSSKQNGRRRGRRGLERGCWWQPTILLSQRRAPWPGVPTNVFQSGLAGGSTWMWVRLEKRVTWEKPSGRAWRRTDPKWLLNDQVVSWLLSLEIPGDPRPTRGGDEHGRAGATRRKDQQAILKKADWSSKMYAKQREKPQLAKNAIKQTNAPWRKPTTMVWRTTVTNRQKQKAARHWRKRRQTVAAKHMSHLQYERWYSVYGRFNDVIDNVVDVMEWTRSDRQWRSVW